MRFGIIDREDNLSVKKRKSIIERLTSIGWMYDIENPELVISIGGDGTLLRAIHYYIDILDSVMFVAIHTGTLGFLTDYTNDEIDQFIQDITTKKPDIESRPMLEIQIPQKNQTCYALNDIRIESLGKTLSLDVYIDDEYFENTSGSGLCISTQAGSSAINRALSGAVVDSGLNVLQLCEIMPISHKNHHTLRNPYIMKEDRIITIQGDSLSLARANYDHLDTGLEDVDVIYIKTSEKKVRFARYRTYSYLKRLKNLY